jgi:hypothetical protein
MSAVTSNLTKPNYKKTKGLVLLSFCCLFLPSNAFCRNINLAWSRSPSANVGGYKLYYGMASRSYSASVDVGNNTAYQFTGLPDNTVYFFSLKAYNVSRTLESGFSNEVNSNGVVTVSYSSTSGGLVASYGFEEANGIKVIDASGNRNHGKIRQATRTKGRFGKALLFDGVNDWVTVKDSAALDLSGSFTLEAWIKPKSVRRSSIIFKQAIDGSVYDLYAFQDADLPVSSFNDGTGYSVISNVNQLPTKGWVHLASTFDGTVQKLFVYGVEVSSSSAQKASIAPSNDVLRIGGNSVWGDYFRGVIDEVRIYNRALTSEEIQMDLKTAVLPRKKRNNE